MEKVDIILMDEFISWAYRNEYFYSESVNGLYDKGWITRSEITNIKNFNERNKLRRSTEKLFEEFCNHKK